MLALKPGKDHTPKPGTLARVFGLPAVRGMTGITCNTIAEIQASAERDSGLGTEGGGPLEVAAREINSKCEPDAVVRLPPGRGEESGAEGRLSSGRGEECTTPRGGGRRGAAYDISLSWGAACNIGPSSLSTFATLQRGVSTPDAL